MMPVSGRIVNLVYFVGFLDLFAVSLVVPLLSKHAKSIGVSPSTAGIVGSIYGGLQLVSSPLVGRWSDVSGRKFVLLCCLGVSALGYFLLGFSTSLTLLVLARIPAGLFKHSQDLIRGYLSDATPLADQSRVFGRLNSASSVGFILGPALGGHLISRHDDGAGYRLAAMVTGSCFLLNLVIVWLFIPHDPAAKPRPPLDHRPDRSSDLSPFSFLRGFREIDWTHIWDLFLVRFLMGFAVLVYRNNFVLMLEYKYAVGAKTTGYITSYSGAVGTLSGFFVGRIAGFYQNDAKLLLHAGVVQFLSLVCLTFSPSLWILVLALTPLGLANQVARVCATNLTIQRGRGQKKGVLLGLGGSILAFARMLSPAVGGFAQEYHTSGPSLLGAVFAGAGVVTMALAPGQDEMLMDKSE